MLAPNQFLDLISFQCSTFSILERSFKYICGPKIMTKQRTSSSPTPFPVKVGFQNIVENL